MRRRPLVGLLLCAADHGCRAGARRPRGRDRLRRTRERTRDPVIVPAAPLPAPPGKTLLVSRKQVGPVFPNAGSIEPSASADGRFVAFTSIASDLVPGDEPRTVDVFVIDRQTNHGPARPAPAALPGTGGRLGSSSDPSISADGSVVAFTWLAPTVVAPASAAPSVAPTSRHRPILLAPVPADVRLRLGPAHEPDRARLAQQPRHAGPRARASRPSRRTAASSPTPRRSTCRATRTTTPRTSSAATAGRGRWSSSRSPSTASRHRGLRERPVDLGDGHAGGVRVRRRRLGGERGHGQRDPGLRPRHRRRNHRAGLAGADRRAPTAPRTSPRSRRTAASSRMPRSSSNLVARRRGAAWRLYRRDRQTGATVLVTVRPRRLPDRGRERPARDHRRREHGRLQPRPRPTSSPRRPAGSRPPRSSAARRTSSSGTSAPARPC